MSHILATLWRVVVAFIIGSGIGFAVGLVNGLVPLVRRATMPVVSALMTVPGMALAPLAVILLGFGDWPIIAVGIIAAIFPLAYQTAAGVAGVPPELVEAAMVEGAEYTEILKYITLPLSLPNVLMGAELSFSKCWRTVIAVEFVAAASRGLGYAILDATEYLRFDTVLMLIAVIMSLHWLCRRIILVTSLPFTSQFI